MITFSDPEPVENAPAWMLGQIRWRGWRLPLLSFSRFAGWSDEEGQIGAKVVVLKALGGNPKLPYFAVLSQGFPRLVTVSHVGAGGTARHQGDCRPASTRWSRSTTIAAAVPDL